MDNLQFGTEEYWHACSGYSYKDKDENLDCKILANLGHLNEEELFLVWNRYNNSSSIIYRIHCLVTLAEYWKLKSDFRKIHSIKGVFEYLIMHSFCFHKQGFLVDCEQKLISRLQEVFVPIDKALLSRMIEHKLFRIKSVLSLVSLGLLDHFNKDEREILKNFVLNNIHIYFEYSDSFYSLFQYFEKKQDNLFVKEIIDCALHYVMSKEGKNYVWGYHQVLENLLVWIHYSSDKDENRNRILLEIRKLSSSIKEQFKGQGIPYGLSSAQVNEIKNEYSSFDSTLDIFIQTAHRFINCYTYQESPVNRGLSEIFNLTLFDTEYLKISSLGTGIEELNIRHCKQTIEIYCMFVNGIYLPFLKERKDFAYVLQNLKIFDNQMDELIFQSLSQYLDENHFLFISSIIPLIEAKLRLLLRDVGEADIKQNKNGGFDFREIGSFFRSRKVQKYLTRSELLVLSMILDNRAGFNLRNKLAHGLMKPSEFNRYYADILLMVVIFISCLEFKEMHQENS